MEKKVNVVASTGPEQVQMEATLRFRRIQDVDRSRRLYSDLYEVAKVPFQVTSKTIWRSARGPRGGVCARPWKPKKVNVVAS